MAEIAIIISKETGLKVLDFERDLLKGFGPEIERELNWALVNRGAESKGEGQIALVMKQSDADAWWRQVESTESPLPLTHEALAALIVGLDLPCVPGGLEAKGFPKTCPDTAED